MQIMIILALRVWNMTLGQKAITIAKKTLMPIIEDIKMTPLLLTLPRVQKMTHKVHIPPDWCASTHLVLGFWLVVLTT